MTPTTPTCNPEEHAGQHLRERGHPLGQLGLHLGERLGLPQRLLQLLLRQLQAFL